MQQNKKMVQQQTVLAKKAEKKAKNGVKTDVLNDFEALQKTVELQTQYFQNFKQMHGGNISRRDRRGLSTNVSPVSARRTLIDRQKEYTGFNKSRASMSPEQLRRA